MAIMKHMLAMELAMCGILMAKLRVVAWKVCMEIIMFSLGVRVICRLCLRQRSIQSSGCIIGKPTNHISSNDLTDASSAQLIAGLQSGKKLIHAPGSAIAIWLRVR